MFDIAAIIRSSLSLPLSIFKPSKTATFAEDFFKEPPSTHFVAHLFSGRYLQGSVLEGSPYQTLLKTLIPYLRYFAFTNPKSPIGKLSAVLIPHFEELQVQAKTIQKVGQKQNNQYLISEATQLHAKIHHLPKGSSYLMLGGWTGTEEEPGHAMLYEITKNHKDTFDLCLISTEARFEPELTTPLIRWRNIEKEKLSVSFFTDLLKPRVLPLWNPNIDSDWMAFIHSTLERTTSQKELVSSVKIPAQQAATCAMDSLLAYIRYKGGGSSLQDLLEFTVLSHVWKSIRPVLTVQNFQDPQARQAIALAEIAAQILLQHHPSSPAAVSLSQEITDKIQQTKEFGIAQIQVPQIYTPKQFPQIKFPHPDYELAPNHIKHLLHSYSHYVLVEKVKTKEKLLLLPMLLVEKEEPLSSVVTPVMTNGPYCTLTCIDGIWQGANTIENLYLAYLFLSMREYSKALWYLQTLSPSQDPQVGQILQWMQNVNDESDEKYALLMYAQKKVLYR